MATRWEITKAVRGSDLPPPSRLIMLTLADVAEVGTAEIPAQFTPSLSVLARETGLDRSTVKRHLAALDEAGWIERTRPDAKAQWEGERTRYRLTLPRGTEPPGVGAEEAHLGADIPQGGRTEPPGVGAENHMGGRTVRHLYTDHSDQSQILSDHSSSAPPKATVKKTITDDDPDFDAFWRAYPRKVGKGQARRAFASAIRKVDAATINAAAERFADWCSRSRTEQQFIPHPSTWLNGERWADEPQPVTAGRVNGHQPYRNPEDLSAYYGDL